MNCSNPQILLLTWCCVAGHFASFAAAGHDFDRAAHHRRAVADAAPSGQRQYAPSREIDILHLAIDVTPDFTRRSLEATATLRFKPIARPLEELKLDAVDLRVHRVTASTKLTGWQATDRQLILTFESPILPDQEASVTVAYYAEPTRGLYFRTPEMGYKPEDVHLFTQGESIEARHWFPCFDAPNEKFTSEITCRVPEGMVVLSNGRKMSQTNDLATGLVAVRWLQDRPHVAYLISLVAGKLKGLEDTYRDLPLAFYTPASQIDYAATSFEGTKDMLAFFEQEIGVAYPWAKYYQVCVNDFVAGGMENTSITTLTDGTLHPAEFQPLRESQGLVAHELVHQWFGDLVTCKDWANLWLNEGFATYYEHLYDGHKDGRDVLLYRQYESRKHITSVPNDTNAIVRRDFKNPDEQFSYLAYPKGAWVLHMLRTQLGEALYRQCVKTWIERHQFGTVITEDLVRVLEELSGRSWDQFFDQYVYHAHHPELTVNYAWDERTKMARLSIQQTQKLSDDVLLFHVPLTVRFKGSFGTVNRRLTVNKLAEDFSLSLPGQPEIVRIDPEVELLAKISFTPPQALLYAQLDDATDAIGRLIATEQLAERRSNEAMDRLQRVLNKDPFHPVRIAASRALRALGSDAAFEALLKSTNQPDARVRQQVVSDVFGFHRDASLDLALAVLNTEKNPDIVATAIRSLGAWHKPVVRERLLKFLNTESFRNVLADAAVDAIRAQDDVVYLHPLWDCLRTNETRFTSGEFGQGLETLAFLARYETNKEPLREFFLGHVSRRKPRVTHAAINALGALGDPKAIVALQKYASGPQGPERSAAERAIATLRDERKTPAAPGGMRNEILELQKQNRDLRQELEDIKRRVESLSSRPATAVTNQASAKPRNK